MQCFFFFQNMFDLNKSIASFISYSIPTYSKWVFKFTKHIKSIQVLLKVKSSISYCLDQIINCSELFIVLHAAQKPAEITNVFEIGALICPVLFQCYVIYDFDELCIIGDFSVASYMLHSLLFFISQYMYALFKEDASPQFNWFPFILKQFIFHLQWIRGSHSTSVFQVAFIKKSVFLLCIVCNTINSLRMATVFFPRIFIIQERKKHQLLGFKWDLFTNDLCSFSALAEYIYFIL